MRIALALALACLAAPAAAQPRNPQIDYPGFQRLAPMSRRDQALRRNG